MITNIHGKTIIYAKLYSLYTLLQRKGASHWQIYFLIFCPESLLVGPVLSVWHHGARLAFAIEYQNWQVHLILFTDIKGCGEAVENMLPVTSFRMTCLRVGQSWSGKSYCILSGMHRPLQIWIFGVSLISDPHRLIIFSAVNYVGSFHF